MSLARPPLQERQSSNGPTVPFASNNPFRRAVSPATGQATINNGLPPTNPFYSAEAPPPVPPSNMNMNTRHPSPPTYLPQSVRSDSLPRQMPVPPSMQRPMQPPMQRPIQSSMQPPMQRPIQPPMQRPMPPSIQPNAATIMNPANRNERPMADPRVPPPPYQFPSSRSQAIPQSRHRPTRSQDASRRQGIEQTLAEEPLNIFATPPKAGAASRSRRNSDSSILEAKREARRPQEHRRKPQPSDTRSRDTKREYKPPKPKKTNAQMDVIDKLDVTSMWGAGFFHHDGPFDAANPRRNRTGNKEAAPMHAFAEGSKNNAIGGSGPVNKSLDLDKIHGTAPEGFADYNAATAVPPPPPAVPQSGRQRGFSGSARTDRILLPERPAIIDSKALTEQVHGEESVGLGTSTFLEGAPAPAARIAGQRRASELENPSQGSGLQRKKSLMQKFRGQSNTRLGYTEQGTVSGMPDRYTTKNGTDMDNDLSQSPPIRSTIPLSAGGRTKFQETTPFFAEEAEKTDVIVDVADVREPGRPIITRNRTLSSPQSRPMLKSLRSHEVGGPHGFTAAEIVQDRAGSGSGGAGGGLLSRVKSLRGGRRGRQES